MKPFNDAQNNVFFAHYALDPSMKDQEQEQGENENKGEGEGEGGEHGGEGIRSTRYRCVRRYNAKTKFIHGCQRLIVQLPSPSSSSSSSDQNNNKNKNSLTQAIYHPIQGRVHLKKQRNHTPSTSIQDPNYPNTMSTISGGAMGGAGGAHVQIPMRLRVDRRALRESERQQRHAEWMTSLGMDEEDEDEEVANGNGNVGEEVDAMEQDLI